MKMQRDLLLFVMVAAATPALAQTATPGAAAIPALSGVWSHPALPWFEPPASGPGPVTNLSRGEQRPDCARPRRVQPVCRARARVAAQRARASDNGFGRQA